MAENSQQQGRSPSQIAAAARGGHDGGQHHGRSPSAIAAAAHGVHGPEAGRDHGIQGGDVLGNGVQLGRSPSQIAAEALSSVHGHAASDGGHVLLDEPKLLGHRQPEWGERTDGKGWAEVIKDQQSGSGGSQRAEDRTLAEDQREGRKEEERQQGKEQDKSHAQKEKERQQERDRPDKGPSLMETLREKMEQAREWVHEHEHGMECY
jgi:hypothetical protein